MRLLLLSLALSLLAAAPAAAATLALDRGNVTVDGNAVTSGGHDADPVLTPDGNHIVFTRLGKASKAMKGCSDDAGPVQAVALWITDLKGGNPHKLLDGHAGDTPEAGLCAFGNKAFDTSGDRLYFDTPAWATSSAIHVLDMKTGDERFFLAGGLVRVLAGCANVQYKDNIIAAQHRYFLFGGSYDWNVLFTPEGQDVGPVGEDGGDLSMVDDACGTGK